MNHSQVCPYGCKRNVGAIMSTQVAHPEASHPKGERLMHSMDTKDISETTFLSIWKVKRRPGFIKEETFV
jgi:hypothetical protein